MVGVVGVVVVVVVVVCGSHIKASPKSSPWSRRCTLKQCLMQLKEQNAVRGYDTPVCAIFR